MKIKRKTEGEVRLQSGDHVLVVGAKQKTVSGVPDELARLAKRHGFEVVPDDAKEVDE